MFDCIQDHVGIFIKQNLYPVQKTISVLFAAIPHKLLPVHALHRLLYRSLFCLILVKTTAGCTETLKG